jgi:hypothetical protein
LIEFFISKIWSFSGREYLGIGTDSPVRDSSFISASPSTKTQSQATVSPFSRAIISEGRIS